MCTLFLPSIIRYTQSYTLYISVNQVIVDQASLRPNMLVLAQAP